MESELRVLVTRPQGRAGELIDALRQRGLQVLHRPMMRIAGLNEDSDADILRATRQRLLELDRYHTVVFISVNAVEHGLGMAADYWPQWPTAQQVYAIGKATARALRERGLTVDGEGDLDSESLLARAELQGVAGQRILIVRGVGGREHLAEVLRGRGARVDYAECYRRLPPALDRAAFLAEIKRIDCVCVNSGETLQNLSDLLPENHRLLQVPLVVPGERVAALAAKLGYARVLVADNAGVDATLALIDRHIIRRGGAE